MLVCHIITGKWMNNSFENKINHIQICTVQSAKRYKSSNYAKNKHLYIQNSISLDRLCLTLLSKYLSSSLGKVSKEKKKRDGFIQRSSDPSQPGIGMDK